MYKPLTRRDILKISILSLGCLAFRKLPAQWPSDELKRPALRARVTVRSIYIYSEPNFKSERIGTLLRDQILRISEEIISTKGPAHNPRWYRVPEGFVHSAYLQRVEKMHLNAPLKWVQPGGQLGEITVPFTQSLRKTITYGWVKLYRLYYQSTYWITNLVEGPDGKLWYELTDDLLHVQYCVPATHVRPIPPEELAPISPEVPSREKRIEVSIPGQALTAYEGDQVVLQAKVSTGIPSNGPTPNGIPTDTPKGYFHVEVKVPSRHMGDGNLTDDIEAYELPGVPWVSFFHILGIAFHGTYWHDNFGRMMSHGCVNLRTEEAKWLYRWTHPVADPQDWNRKGHGTLVEIT
jgi:hypothetical protein